MTMRTTTIALPARNVERATAFYRELLGLRRSDANGLPVVFEQREASESTAVSSTASLRLGRLSRLEHALQVAWEKGGRIVECAQRRERGAWCATIVDTEGNVVSLHARA
jgi:predicted enzyme related to lactoylglutathione lyase